MPQYLCSVNAFAASCGPYPVECRHAPLARTLRLEDYETLADLRAENDRLRSVVSAWEPHARIAEVIAAMPPDEFTAALRFEATQVELDPTIRDALDGAADRIDRFYAERLVLARAVDAWAPIVRAAMKFDASADVDDATVNASAPYRLCESLRAKGGPLP